jgi:DNA-binding response OmpR family regulator
MIVDDDPLIRQLLSYQLGTAGYHVSTAQSGHDALERLIRDHPDIVLLDVVMPGISGWDVCHQIRTCSPVPVIMLTAKTAENDVLAGLESGADDYIAKPFSLPQLLARIEAVLRRSRSFAVWQSRPAGNGGVYAGMPTDRWVASMPSMPPMPSIPPLTSPATPSAPAKKPRSHTSSTPNTSPGQKIAQARRQQGLSLEQAAAASGIHQEVLWAIEQEHLDDVPKDELPHLLKQYSDFLGLDLRSLLTQAQPPLPILPIYLVIFVMMVLILAILVTMPPL